MTSKTQFQMVQDAWSQFENKGEITSDVANNLLSVVSDLTERNALLEFKASKPTIADYLAANKPMIDKTKCKMVSVSSLVEFGSN